MPTSEDIALALDGLRFPATRHDLYQYLVEHEADPDIIALVHRLPERTFGNIQDLYAMMPEVE